MHDLRDGIRVVCPSHEANWYDKDGYECQDRADYSIDCQVDHYLAEQCCEALSHEILRYLQR